MIVDLGAAAALLLAGVLLWAGVAKLRRPDEVRASFVQLGIPSPVTSARLVPVVEIAVAVALVARPADGAVAALALLAAFTALLVSVVRSGREVSCGCFGAGRTEPVSSADVVRNALLLVAALVALGGPRTWSLPPLHAVIAVTALAAAGRLVVALTDVAHTTGHLLPGPPAGPPPARVAALGSGVATPLGRDDRR